MEGKRKNSLLIVDIFISSIYLYPPIADIVNILISSIYLYPPTNGAKYLCLVNRYLLKRWKISRKTKMVPSLVHYTKSLNQKGKFNFQSLHPTLHSMLTKKVI